MKKVSLAVALLLLGGPVYADLVVGQNFQGVTLDDDITLNPGTRIRPPDSMGAIGPNYFVEFVNNAFAIYNKANGSLAVPTISASNFWINKAGISSSIVSEGLSDPRILFDPNSQRWFAAQITVRSTGNHVLLARSDTADPTGTWKGVSFVGNAGGADYPTLGLDRNAVYIGTNNFTSLTADGVRIANNPVALPPSSFAQPSSDLKPSDVSTQAFTGVSLFSIPKADLLASTPSLANMTSFQNLDANARGFTLQGATNFGPPSADNHGVIIAVDNQFFGRIDRTTINGPGGPGATLSPTTVINVAATSFPNPARQPDGTRNIDALDDRFSASVYQVGNLLYLAHAITVGTHDAIRWSILNELTNAVVQEGTLSDPNFDLFQPSILANTFGEVVIGYNRSDSTALGAAGNISSFAVAGTTTGGVLTFGAPMLLRQGVVGNYHIDDPTGTMLLERWGDYSATTLDPSDPHSFWTIQEFPLTDGSTTQARWATQITQLTFVQAVPEPSALTLLGLGSFGLIGYVGRWGKTRKG